MSNWRKVRLSDIGTIVGGATPSTTVEKYYGGNIPWLTPKDLSSFNDRYITRGERNITEDGLKSCSAQLLPKGSVLFSSRAPIGYVDPIATNQGFKSIIPNKDTNSLFLYYLLKYNKANIEAMGSGTTFKEVSGATMKNIEVLLPPLVEQERIAGILGALDDKIECNNRINRNLEEQAAALFRRWFVDFEFPDPNGKPYRSNGGTFTDSPLGEIPEGWRVGTLGDLIIATIGGDWGKENAEGNYSQKVYCIRGADIIGVSKGEKGKMPFRYILPKNHLSKKLEENDLVVEISGGSPTQSTGRIAIISNSLLKRYDQDMICTNFCRAIKPKQNYAHFIYGLWRYLYEKNIMFSYENGTTGIKNLDINGLLDTELIVIPSCEALVNYNNLLKDYFNTIFTNALENETLAELRDSLLPKLMNNEIKE